jgi:Glycosyl transferase family 2
MILSCKQVLEWHFIITLLLFFNLINGNKISADEAHSPLHQNLPDCTHPYDTIRKKTKKKAMACPMIKDEEGFLSEWVAYYQMHGFDHIVFFDDSSIDEGLAELQPWIQSGFVSVRSNFSVDTVNLRSNLRDKAFRTSMGLKVLLETECKLEAIRLGYDYYFSLDLDEFIVPKLSGITIVDAVRISTVLLRF